MPFTISHFGYSLLFHKCIKKDVFLTTIVVSSFVPDLDIIFRFTNNRLHIFNYSFFQVILVLMPIALLIDVFVNLCLLNKYKKIFNIPVDQHFNYLNFIKSNWIIEIVLIIVFLYFHLILDFFTHIDANDGMIVLYALFGNRNMLDFYYLFSMYFLPLVASIIGLYLLYKYCQDKQIVVPFPFIILFIIITITYAFVRILIFKLEKGFEFDTIIIQLTGGIFVAFFIAPLLYNKFVYASRE